MSCNGFVVTFVPLSRAAKNTPVVREQSDRLRKLAFMHEARQLCFGIEESFHSWDFFFTRLCIIRCTFYRILLMARDFAKLLGMLFTRAQTIDFLSVVKSQKRAGKFFIKPKWVQSLG